MPDDFDILSLLDLPSRIVAQVRDILALVGVEPPLWLVQGIALSVCLVLLAWFAALAWRGSRGIGRVSSLVGAIAAGAVILGILWSIADRAANPPTGQVRGNVGIPVPAGVEVWLLDHAGRAIAAALVDASSGDFVANYPHDIDEPPRAVIARAQGCADRQVTLGRRQLQFGAPVALRLDCNGRTA
ncbi:MAG: hypothetical protein ACXIUV_05465 [Alkalilacustris sp.]